MIAQHRAIIIIITDTYLIIFDHVQTQNWWIRTREFSNELSRFQTAALWMSWKRIPCFASSQSYVFYLSQPCSHVQIKKLPSVVAGGTDRMCGQHYIQLLADVRYAGHWRQTSAASGVHRRMRSGCRRERHNRCPGNDADDAADASRRRRWDIQVLPRVRWSLYPSASDDKLVP